MQKSAYEGSRVSLSRKYSLVGEIKPITLKIPSLPLRAPTQNPHILDFSAPAPENK
jgi:hypothetical protein